MRVAFLGLGIMGSRMAANLAAAGHQLSVWTRTDGKAAAWAAEHGATAQPTPAAAATGAEVVISMVVDGPQVLALAGELANSGHGEGRLLVDMSTIGPEAARTASAVLAAAGWGFMDAPVTGSSPKAADGTLTIMAGGRTEDFERVRPLLDAMGALVLHVGDTGQGQMVKLINNATAAANTAAAAQALLVGSATGVDLDALVQVMNAGSGGSAALALKAGPMREHDYTTLFKLEHMLKDVRLCLEEAQRAGVPFSAASAARDVLSAAMGRGLGDADFVALLEPLEGLAGRRL
ncbi:NAD(P)-dependent oxidoreductase [Paraconexibacter antarcticus]|uniref:NAD(P)-dependent oxidoreductase n=1 Tax=Paraconexibacter antarcticus TaxID=2949664 RepID=A0ABY5E296_9ACTN|nr:NAD(P)-dependent oxidoreductase [Paraconexibacter antarcticus]UTI66957.1 NAD(P)-dependent oxidoreductase [Paraconexibacter antarcticus]